MGQQLKKKLLRETKENSRENIRQLTKKIKKNNYYFEKPISLQEIGYKINETHAK